jgi:nicotinate-nucleotide adenylyltransferase
VERLGVFGGTFDPPHIGHLALAEQARDQLGLSRVLFVPARVPPHKRGRVSSPIAVRMALTRLAVRGHAAFAVSDVEARRPGPSFTVDTLRALARRHPHAERWLILGADSLDDFAGWRDPDAILSLASLAGAARPGAGRRRLPPALARRVTWIDAPALDVSSRALRDRVRAGRSIRYLVPDAVAAAIARRRLYRGNA